MDKGPRAISPKAPGAAGNEIAQIIPCTLLIRHFAAPGGTAKLILMIAPEYILILKIPRRNFCTEFVWI